MEIKSMGYNFEEIEQKQKAAENEQRIAVEIFIDAAKKKSRRTIVDRFVIWLVSKNNG